MRASDALLKAADVMRVCGHAKGVLKSESGGVCLSGAIRCALHGDAHSWSEEVPRLVVRVADVVGLKYDDSYAYAGNSRAIDWNNHEATGAQVIAALDAAAIVALQEEGIDPEDVL